MNIATPGRALSMLKIRSKNRQKISDLKLFDLDVSIFSREPAILRVRRLPLPLNLGDGSRNRRPDAIVEEDKEEHKDEE